MGEQYNNDSDEITSAVLTWTGYETSLCPTRVDATFAERRSDADASRIMRLVKSLESDFYRSDAHIKARSLTEMKKLAIEDFQRLHPEMNARISEALAWFYSYDYR